VVEGEVWRVVGTYIIEKKEVVSMDRRIAET
jgi:hypothetical protein